MDAVAATVRRPSARAIERDAPGARDLPPTHGGDSRFVQELATTVTFPAADSVTIQSSNALEHRSRGFLGHSRSSKSPDTGLNHSQKPTRILNRHSRWTLLATRHARRQPPARRAATLSFEHTLEKEKRILLLKSQRCEFFVFSDDDDDDDAREKWWKTRRHTSLPQIELSLSLSLLGRTPKPPAPAVQCRGFGIRFLEAQYYLEAGSCLRLEHDSSLLGKKATDRT